MTTRSQKKQQNSQPEQPPLLATPSGLLEVEGAAEWLKVSRAKLFELMRDEDLPVIRLTEKLIRFDPNSLYLWALKKQNNGRKMA